MTTGFTNKRSLLLGSDTHSSSLSGSVSQAETNAQSENGNLGTTIDTNFDEKYTAGSAGTTRATFTDVATPTDSLMILVIGQATRSALIDEQTKTWLWKKDTVTFSTVNLSPTISSLSNKTLLSTVVITPTAGTHTYTLVENDATSFGSVSAKITFIQLTDTHAATLTGSNTQRTVAEGILS